MNTTEHNPAENPYVLLTAARNEADYIRGTIQSVVAQTRKPRCWMIISDGSTDATDDIVAEFAATHPFIQFLRVDADADRNFGSKAAAINAGYEKIKHIEHRWVGVLDADVSFNSDYYERIIDQFKQAPDLGIAGGILIDQVNDRLVPQQSATEWSVSGPVQMFRRECFCAIGGYMPLRGGIDAAAEVMARMNGWRVQAFPELKVLHHRQTGRQNHQPLGIFFHRGLEDYCLGYHPLFFAARAIRRFRESPWVAGGLAMLCGYAWAGLSGSRRKVPPDFVRFLRQEQMSRLRGYLRRKETCRS